MLLAHSSTICSPFFNIFKISILVIFVFENRIFLLCLIKGKEKEIRYTRFKGVQFDIFWCLLVAFYFKISHY